MTNRSGLTVGYLGNLGTDSDIGRTDPYTYAELVDVNDRGNAAGRSGTFTKSLFGWADLGTLRAPGATKAHRVVTTQLNDINARGSIVGNIFGLTARAFNKLQRVYPVLWTCAFGR